MSLRAWSDSSPSTGLAQDSQEQFAGIETQIATSAQSKKRLLDVSKIDLLPAKRSRSMLTRTQLIEVEDEKAASAAKV